MHTHTNYSFKVQLKVVIITVQINPELDVQTNTTPHARSVVGETGTQQINVRGCVGGCAGVWARVCGGKCGLPPPATSGLSSDFPATPTRVMTSL